MNIKKEVKGLDINEAFKHLLSELISAQIFSIQKFYSPETTMSANEDTITMRKTYFLYED